MMSNKATSRPNHLLTELNTKVMKSMRKEQYQDSRSENQLSPVRVQKKQNTKMVKDARKLIKDSYTSED